MHTAAKVTIGIGIVAIIIGIILFATTGDDFEDDIEEGIIYDNDWVLFVEYNFYTGTIVEL